MEKTLSPNVVRIWTKLGYNREKICIKGHGQALRLLLKEGYGVEL